MKVNASNWTYVLCTRKALLSIPRLCSSYWTISVTALLLHIQKVLCIVYSEYTMEIGQDFLNSLYLFASEVSGCKSCLFSNSSLWLCLASMVFILDGSSFYYAHKCSESGISICLRRLVRKSRQILIIFRKRPILHHPCPTCSDHTILYNYHGFPFLHSMKEGQIDSHNILNISVLAPIFMFMCLSRTVQIKVAEGSS